jgi:hypothetical protein
MKKIKVFLFIFLCSICAHWSLAQTEKKGWLIGGTGSLQASKSGGFRDNYLSINLRPQVGYFVAKNLALGVALPLNLSGFWSSDSRRDYYNNSQNVGANLIGRYYFLPNKTKLFLHGEVGFLYSRIRNEVYGVTNTPSPLIRSKTTPSYRFGAGIVHFITPNVGLELQAGYTQSENFIETTFSHNLSLGLFAYLNKNTNPDNSFTPNTQAKTWLIGGSAGLAYNSTDFSNNTNINIAPKVGRFLKDNFVVGLSVPMNFSFSEFKNFPVTYTIRSQGYNINLNTFARYYFLPNKTKLFILAELGFSRYALESDFSGTNIPVFIGNPNESKNRLMYALGGGITRFLSPSVAIEATLDYRNMSFITDQRVLFGQVGVFTFLSKN